MAGRGQQASDLSVECTSQLRREALGDLQPTAGRRRRRGVEPALLSNGALQPLASYTGSDEFPRLLSAIRRAAGGVAAGAHRAGAGATPPTPPRRHRRQAGAVVASLAAAHPRPAARLAAARALGVAEAAATPGWATVLRPSIRTAGAAVSRRRPAAAARPTPGAAALQPAVPAAAGAMRWRMAAWAAAACGAAAPRRWRGTTKRSEDC